MPKQVHLFGIRHHGPGSARALLRALDAVRPECVLVEGPPDADGVIASAAHEEMRPPVAILVYRADDPRRGAYYPFAEYSPEWCAIRWALAAGVPVRFMDLPQTHRLARDESVVETASPDQVADDEPKETENGEPAAVTPQVRFDPLGELAQAAGFDDGERWWEHTFEHRRHADTEVFAAVREAMAALREDQTSANNPILRDEEERLREAWMRRTIREAQREFEQLAVVCGAWHAPALGEAVLKAAKKDDDAALKALEKVKTVATWIPWTFDRLASASGYGAGVRSPGWYEHLWRTETHVLEHWMMRVGRMLRDQDLDCSSAHVIEATRLANALASMRERPLADLSDIADACRAVFCFDSDLATRLIARKLLIGERLGEVPEDTPLVPLAQDLQAQQKRLRLKPEAQEKTLDLDLRGESDLARSVLLHRLRLIGVDWGVPQSSRAGKGTFHELWQLRWQPEYLVRLIEIGVWGNTIEAAASAYTCHQAAEANDLEQLTSLLGDLLLANLPSAVSALMQRILTAAAVAADVAKLMDAFPPLAEVARYGNVRQTDKELVQEAIDGVLPRIVVGLGPATASLSDDAARDMELRIVRVHEAVQLLDAPAAVEDWLACLGKLSDQSSVHGLLRGRATRLLFDLEKLASDDVARRLSLMLSRGADPVQGSAWIEGFLSTSGLVLLHHEDLLRLVDDWLVNIPPGVFQEQVPLLRRTFARFPAPERRQIGERLRAGLESPRAAATSVDNLDVARAARVLPTLRLIFGTAVKGDA